jgi:hypothetical protein
VGLATERRTARSRWDCGPVKGTVQVEITVMLLSSVRGNQSETACLQQSGWQCWFVETNNRRPNGTSFACL